MRVDSLSHDPGIRESRVTGQWLGVCVDGFVARWETLHSVSTVLYGLMELSVAVHASAVGSDRGREYFEEARGA